MRTMREITHYLPLQLTWTKQHLPPERAWVAEDRLCTKNVAITPSELGDWNPHLSHHQTVQLQVKNSLMFIIWIKEMVFSPQDQSQGWIRTRREEKAFQKVHRWGRAWEGRRGVRGIRNTHRIHIPFRDGCFHDLGSLNERQKGRIQALIPSELCHQLCRPRFHHRARSGCTEASLSHTPSNGWRHELLIYPLACISQGHSEAKTRNSAASETWPGPDTDPRVTCWTAREMPPITWAEDTQSSKSLILGILYHWHKSLLSEKWGCTLFSYVPRAMWATHNLSNGRRNFIWGWVGGWVGWNFKQFPGSQENSNKTQTNQP